MVQTFMLLRRPLIALAFAVSTALPVSAVMITGVYTGVSGNGTQSGGSFAYDDSLAPSSQGYSEVPGYWAIYEINQDNSPGAFFTLETPSANFFDIYTEFRIQVQNDARGSTNGGDPYDYLTISGFHSPGSFIFYFYDFTATVFTSSDLPPELNRSSFSFAGLSNYNITSMSTVPEPDTRASLAVATLLLSVFSFARSRTNSRPLI